MSPNDRQALAASLAKLWPNRLHESNSFKNLFCRLGIHRWASLDLKELAQGKDVRFCRWCSDVEIDGEIYGE
jgi:hypothetical protein